MENGFQLCSRVVQILNGDPAASPLGGAHRRGAPYSSPRAPQRVRLGPSLAAAALENRFEHPAATSAAQPFQSSVFQKTCLELSLATVLLDERFPYSHHGQAVSRLLFEIQGKGRDDLVEGFWLFQVRQVCGIWDNGQVGVGDLFSHELRIGGRGC